MSNLGTETMSHYDSLCWNTELGLPASDKGYYEYEPNTGIVWFNPGNSEEIELRIKVTDKDVKAGEVRRNAQMSFLCLLNEDGSPVTSAAPDGKGAPGPGVYPTNEVEIVIPLLKPEADPQPAAPSAPQIRAYCVPALTEAGENAARWKLTRCNEHAKIAAAVSKLLSQAEGEAAQAAAWEAAVKQWNKALEAEYKAMNNNAKKNKALRTAIEKEKKRFDSQLTAYRTALALEYPDDPARVSRKVAEVLARRTSMLCYERHTAPEARTDLLSASAGEQIQASAAVLCRRRTDEIADILYINDTICAEHTDIEAMAVAAGDADAWKRVRQAWQEALDGITDRRYLATEEAGKAIISEQRLSFGRWLEAREAMLTLEYPDQEAAVQELMARAIRERVIDLCDGDKETGEHPEQDGAER